MNGRTMEKVIAIWKRFNFHFVAAATVTIVIYHYSVITEYSFNLPYWDDFDSVLQWLNNFHDASSLREKFTLLISRHNEHRIIFNRITVLADWFLFKTVNFQLLILFGNSLLILLLVTIFFYFKKWQSNPWIACLPAPLILLSLNSYEAFIWSMVSISTFGVILFAFLCLYAIFFSKEPVSTVRLLIAFCAGAIATFTNGNGFLILVLAFVALIVKKEKRMFAAAWLFLSLIVIYLNYRNYVPVAYHPSPMATFKQQPELLVPHFFTLLGNYFQTYGPYHYPIVIISGFFVLSTFLYYVVPQKLYVKDPIAFYFLCFIVLSCALTSLGRAAYGAGQALAARYQIYSGLAVLFLYFSLINSWQTRVKLKSVVIALIVAIALLNYLVAVVHKTLSLEDMHSAATIAAMDYHQNTSSFAFPDQQAALSMIVNSKTRGTYNVPNLTINDRETPLADWSVPEETGTVNWNLEIKPFAKFKKLDGWAYIEGRDMTNCKVYIVLRSTTTDCVVETRRKYSHDVTLAMNSGDLDWSGFTSIINKSKIAKGTYKIGIYVREKTFIEKPFYGFEFTNRQLVIE